MELVLVCVITAIIGFVFGMFVRNRMEGSELFEYFACPSSKTFELDWTGRQFLRLFSEGMSERWYESRAHLYQGFWMSLLATLHLVHVVRIEYETSRDGYVSFVTVIVHGFQSIDTLKKKLPKLTQENKKYAKDASHWYQTFVTGHNVVNDFMNEY